MTYTIIDIKHKNVIFHPQYNCIYNYTTNKIRHDQSKYYKMYTNIINEKTDNR